jgi:hypothetical protein
MRPDPASTLPETVQAAQTRRVDVTRGPAPGLGVAIPWALAAWTLIGTILSAIL